MPAARFRDAEGTQDKATPGPPVAKAKAHGSKRALHRTIDHLTGNNPPDSVRNTPEAGPQVGGRQTNKRVISLTNESTRRF